MDTQKELFSLCGELERIGAGLEDVLNLLLLAQEQLWSLRGCIEARPRNNGEAYKDSLDKIQSLLNIAVIHFSSELRTLETVIQHGYRVHRNGEANTQLPTGTP